VAYWPSPPPDLGSGRPDLGAGGRTCGSGSGPVAGVAGTAVAAGACSRGRRPLLLRPCGIVVRRRPLGPALAPSGSASLVTACSRGGVKAKAFGCLQADDGDASGRRCPPWRHHPVAPPLPGLVQASPPQSCSEWFISTCLRFDLPSPWMSWSWRTGLWMICHRYLVQADALPPLFLRSSLCWSGRCFATAYWSGRMLCRRCSSVLLLVRTDALLPLSFSGGCFATLVVLLFGGCFATIWNSRHCWRRCISFAGLGVW